MAQNKTHAVMAQRSMLQEQQAHEDFPGQSDLDDFPSPPWAGRALLQHLRVIWSLRAGHFTPLICWEPAANRRYLSGALAEYFGTVFVSDIHDYGHDVRRHDFLSSALPAQLIERPDWIITNPPYIAAEKFIARALEIAQEGVAMLVRTLFLEGQDRFTDLYAARAPSLIAQFSERVPMLKGRCNNRVIDPKTGEEKAASTATSYAWLVWRRSPKEASQPWLFGHGRTEFSWIPPCRAALERPDQDYRGEAPR